MNEYEKYRLQWMLDHDYSLPDLLERLSDIAMNENLDEIQNPRVMLNEAFERLEYEQGFDNEEIWLCKDEWEHDLYSSNEYSLTDAGKTKAKHFIEDCRIKHPVPPARDFVPYRERPTAHARRLSGRRDGERCSR